MAIDNNNPRQRRYDVPAMKAAARGQWPDILSRLGGISQDILDGRHHPCPKCGGTDRFRFTNLNDDGSCLCNQCGRNIGDGFAALGWLCGWSFGQTAQFLAEHLGVEPLDNNGKGGGGKGKKSGGKSGSKSDKHHDRTNAVYVSEEAAIKVAVGELSAASHAPATLAGLWRYDGFAVVRFDLPTPAGEKQKKTFKPIHQTKLSDGRPAWRWGYPPGPRPLYHKTELLNAVAENGSTAAVVVGGEKAAEAACGLGLTATTCAGGEKAIAQTDWTPLLSFGRVVVSVDNDAAGEAYGVAVAGVLAKLRPDLPVQILRLPGLPAKGDIVEWIAAGGTREAFLALCENKEVAKPPDMLSPHRAICAAFGIEVIGETVEDRQILVFGVHHGKGARIREISRLSVPELYQICGPTVREKLYQGRDDPPPGQFGIDRVREAIAAVAGASRIEAGSVRGLGVWAGGCQGNGNGGGSSGENTHSICCVEPPIVLVNPRYAGVWNGERLDIVRRPFAGGIKVDLDQSSSDQWYEPGVLVGYLAASADLAWRSATIEEIGRVIDQWYWHAKDAEAKDRLADIIIGLILATFIQTVWDWRPLIAIAGTSDSGKTLFMETLAAILGPLAILSSKSTEAGLRQSVAHHSRVLLCDEFESDKHRRAILEFFRTASRGSKTLRGSSQQRAVSQGLRHIPWVTAVEVGLERAPDRNRFIVLELDAPPKDRRGRINLPNSDQLADLGQRLLAMAVRFANAAVRRAAEIRATPVEGVHGRVVESWAVPAAILGTICDRTVEETRAMLQRYLDVAEIDPSQATKDETHLLADILTSVVDLGRGDRATVGQLLSRPADYVGGWDALARVGIGVIAEYGGLDAETNARSRRGLFIAYRQVRRSLLRGTEWEGQSIDQLLKRLPDATKSQQRVGCNRPWGIEVPWGWLRNKFIIERDLDF